MGHWTTSTQTLTSSPITGFWWREAVQVGTSLSANQVRVGSATVAAHQTSVGCDSLHLLYQVRRLEVIKLTIRDVLMTPFGLLGAMAKNCGAIGGMTRLWMMRCLDFGLIGSTTLTFHKIILNCRKHVFCVCFDFLCPFLSLRLFHNPAVNNHNPEILLWAPPLCWLVWMIEELFSPPFQIT